MKQREQEIRLTTFTLPPPPLPIPFTETPAPLHQHCITLTHHYRLHPAVSVRSGRSVYLSNGVVSYGVVVVVVVVVEGL
ncbi:hypothetical protein E2C01_067459 [Portunus trituberculatus]|uniref:Uncharacterized protein n=1 Tax=Portunus trituberculatus TaxID=210409 RepID=A0A5B7HJV2_PORTR|nr:hypothetical protein [Portunus trituberculatus]